MGKEGEGSSQRTCIKDPWTRTKLGGGLRVGEGLNAGAGGQGRGE